MEYTINKGWLVPARRVLSPNFGPRPVDDEPTLLVIHNISLPPGEYAGRNIELFFCNCLESSGHPYFEEINALQVSAHLLIRRCGDLVQFVNLEQRAWHAGLSSFEGRDNCNDYSIGIELEGSDDEPYTAQQYRCLAQVTRTLLRHFPGLNPERIVGHCDIAPGRKTDPGPAFDWQRYRQTLKMTGDD